MATYLIKNEKIITRQEGDDSDISFIVPDCVDMTSGSAKFVVFNNRGEDLVKKNSADGSITITVQNLYIPIKAEDLKTHHGNQRWECQVTTVPLGIITIGRGPFIILKEHIDA